jgi:hypothetical protein
MSLFISPENQNLLYEMIHKTAEIKTVFSTIDEKNTWFREIIEKKYRQLPPNISRDQLKQYNREVLGQMMESLRNHKHLVPTLSPISPVSPISINLPMNLLKREIPLEPKEYTGFFDIPKPQQIDFSEKMDDEVITNMDELIENQKRLRERELQEYAPPPPVASSSLDPFESKKSNITISISDPKIKILEQLPKEVLKPIEKHVQFQLPDSSISQDIQLLKGKVENIENKLDEFIRLFRSENTKPQILVEQDPVNVLKRLISEG